MKAKRNNSTIILLISIIISSYAQTYSSLTEAVDLPAGVHTFNFGDGPFEAYVDGEGWMLWLQYHHRGGTDPDINIINSGNNLPVYDPSGLGTDNSGDLTKWGHGSQLFASSIPDDRLWLRWQAETSNHERIIHFESPALGDFQENSEINFIDEVRTNFYPRPDHTARIPQLACCGKGYDVNNYALLHTPFREWDAGAWQIKEGSSWAVDDKDVGNAMNTIHRVWVKQIVFDKAPFLNAITKLRQHIEGTITLSNSEIDAHNLLFQTYIDEIGNDREIISEAIRLINVFENIIGPLFLTPNTEGGIIRDPSRQPDLEIERAMLTLQQGVFDFAFSDENIANNLDLLENFYFKTSAYFPGSVDPPIDASIEEKANVRCDFRTAWGVEAHNGPGIMDAVRPTGCYLAPGSIATVTVPEALVGKGYSIRVGAHFWDLEEKWIIKRMDRISKLYPINSESTQIANPLGGNIYIQVPKGANEGIQEVSLTNVVRSPFFSAKDFHKTSLDEWLNVERNLPGPWADIESDKAMFQVPSSWIRKYDDPITLMEDWDKAMDAINDLVARPHYHDKHHTYQIADVIIRGGAMHPGYPMSNYPFNPKEITSYTGDGTNRVFLNGPRKGSTIYYHEHGHQINISKFQGEKEALVNFPYVAVFNRAFGVDLDTAFKNSFAPNESIFMDDAAEMRMLSITFRAGEPRDISRTTTNEVNYQPRGYAHYAEIVKMFGWCALSDFWYSENEDFMNGIVNPNNNDDDRSFRMSKAAKVDLRPLFHFYGIHPNDPETLESRIAAENLPPSRKIYDRLQEYKQLIPMNNEEFMAHALERYPGGLNEGKSPDYGIGYFYAWSTIYNETHGAASQKTLQDIIDLYFPDGAPIDSDPDLNDNDCRRLLSTDNINAIANDQSYKIYPNPFNDNITINIVNSVLLSNEQKLEITFFNSLGQVILQTYKNSSEEIIIDTSSLKTGQLYILQVKDATGNVSNKKAIKY